MHVVCNNAGVATAATRRRTRLDDWEWVLGVNLWGVIHGVRTFLPLMIEQGEGHIVNTGSVASFATGLPTFSPYTTSKFAVLGFSECLEIELRTGGEDIGVSLLAPGVVATRMPDAERNRPEGVPSTEDDPLRHDILESLRTAVKQVGMDPAQVAAMVVDAIRHRRFFVLDASGERARGDAQAPALDGDRRGAGHARPVGCMRVDTGGVTQAWICETCAVEHAEASGTCAVCADDRQWVPAGGQRWTTLDDLAASGRKTRVRELEDDLFGITVEPKVGIGQQAHLVRTPVGTVLWDPTGYVDDEAAARNP